MSYNERVGDYMNSQLFTGSDYLFARPSFLEGMGRAIDLFGVMDDYNFSESGEEADRRAIAADWNAVYGDLNAAYEGLKCQLDQKMNAV
jgi:hypothetical protein